METDTPVQEDPDNQADEGHLQDGAVAASPVQEDPLRGQEDREEEPGPQRDRQAHAQAGVPHPKNRKHDDERGKFQRNHVTLTEKARLLKQFDKLPKMSKYKAADCLGIKRPFLYNLLENRDKIMNHKQGWMNV